eukprot:1145890-Pelagomonas_calceolata.AAC.1
MALPVGAWRRATQGKAAFKAKLPFRATFLSSYPSLHEGFLGAALRAELLFTHGALLKHWQCFLNKLSLPKQRRVKPLHFAALTGNAEQPNLLAEG